MQHSQELDCEAFLSFFFITVGVLLPLAVLIWTEPPASLRAWEARRRRAQPAGDRCGSLRRTGGRAALVVEGALRELCGRSWMAPAPRERGADVVALLQGEQPAGAAGTPWKLQGWQRPVAWWLLLSLVWGLARVHHAMVM